MSTVGTAYWVEQYAADPFTAVSRAIQVLQEQTQMVDVAEVSVSTRLINPDDSQPFEAIAFASLFE